jgi:hypothetical protein
MLMINNKDSKHVGYWLVGNDVAGVIKGRSMLNQTRQQQNCTNKDTTTHEGTKSHTTKSTQFITATFI